MNKLNFTRNPDFFPDTRYCYANPGPASTNTEHPIGGGSGPAYLGSAGGAIGFYQDPFAGGAVTQRASAFQAVISVSQVAGVMVNFQGNSQMAANVLTAQNISATYVTLTGAPMLSSADVLILNANPPFAQWGIANARVSTASMALNNTIFSVHQANLNISGVSSTTLTGVQFIGTAFRGAVVNTVTLTPSVVAANTTAEQQFTVTGLAPGMVVPVVKGGDQQGLGIAGTRVVSNNVLGITYINTNNTATTPTASEVYSYVGLAGIPPIAPVLTVGINMSAAPPITVTGGTTTGATIKVTGVQGTDQVLGCGQQILPDQVGINLVACRVSAASNNYVTMTFFKLGDGLSTSPITANSTDTWLIPMVRQQLEAPMSLYNVTVPATNLGPNTCTEIGVTVTGITVTCAVHVTKPTATAGIGVLGYRVSSAAAAGSTIGITFGNPTNATIAIPSELYTVAAFKPVFGVGHYVQQMVSPLNVANVQLTNEMRNTLAGLNLFAGG